MKSKGKTKKLMAALLAVMLTAGMIPATAFAADSPETVGEIVQSHSHELCSPRLTGIRPIKIKESALIPASRMSALSSSGFLYLYGSATSSRTSFASLDGHTPYKNKRRCSHSCKQDERTFFYFCTAYFCTMFMIRPGT